METGKSRVMGARSWRSGSGEVAFKGAEFQFGKMETLKTAVVKM